MSKRSDNGGTTIGLVGDGDDVFVVEECEEIFGIRLEDDDVESVKNVGEYYDLIVSVGGFADRRTSCCYAQKGFYRLRRRLRALGYAGRIIPHTRMYEVLDSLGMSYSKFSQYLDDDLGRNVPCGQVARGREWLSIGSLLAAIGSWVSCVIYAASVLPAIPWVGVFGWFLVGFVGLIVVAACVMRVFETELPIYCETVGGLARVYGAVCFDEDPLATKKASPGDIWDRLGVCLRWDNGYGGPIYPMTEFFGKRKEYPAPR